MKEEKFRIADYIYLLVKWRKLIIINFVIVCFCIAVYSLIMPKTFTTQAVILPPQESGALGLAALVPDLPFEGFGSFGSSGELLTFMAILNSTTMAEEVVLEFNLKEKYGVEYLEEAISAFKEKRKVDILEDGTMTLEVQCETGYFSSEEDAEEIRNLVADIGRFMVKKLDEINIEIQTTQAKYNRIFIEERYNENKEDLKRVENELKEFQSKNNAISLPEQVEGAIKAAAEIKAEIISTEIQLSVLKKSLNEKHPEVLEKQSKINQLKKALNDMMYGSVNVDDPTKLFPSFSEVPELGIKLFQLKRELEVQNKLYEFLTQQYEQAKLQEIKDTPTVQVLDPPKPPLYRSKPRRSIMVLAAGMASIFASLLLIAIIEFWERLKNDEDNKTYRLIVNSFQKDLSWLKLNRKKNAKKK